MFGIIGIVAIVGVVLLAHHALGGLGQGLVKLFEKIGIGKTGSYVFGACIFLVILAILKYYANSWGM